LLTGGGAGARTIGGSTLGIGAEAGSAFVTASTEAASGAAGAVAEPLS